MYLSDRPVKIYTTVATVTSQYRLVSWLCHCTAQPSIAIPLGCHPSRSFCGHFISLRVPLIKRNKSYEFYVMRIYKLSKTNRVRLLSLRCAHHFVSYSVICMLRKFEYRQCAIRIMAKNEDNGRKKGRKRNNV